MPARGSVTRLIIDLRSDEPAVRELAARLVWGRYFQELLALARSHLSARIRGREDEEDVLQSMYKSFCLRQRRGDFDLANRDELWKLLVQITLRKARNTANRHLQGKRDVRRDAIGNAAPADGFDEPAALLNQLDTDDPTPAEAALLERGPGATLPGPPRARTAGDRAEEARGLYQPGDRRRVEMHPADGRAQARPHPRLLGQSGGLTHDPSDLGSSNAPPALIEVAFHEFRPEGAETSQPRATPREPWGRTMSTALKGHDKGVGEGLVMPRQGDGYCRTIAPRGDGLGLDCSGPFGVVKKPNPRHSAQARRRGRCPW